MTKYLVQCKRPSGEASCGMFTGEQIIDMYGCRDVTQYEYEVFEVNVFGSVLKLEHRQDSYMEPRYHRFVLPRNLGGGTVISGFSHKTPRQTQN